MHCLCLLGCSRLALQDSVLLRLLQAVLPSSSGATHVLGTELIQERSDLQVFTSTWWAWNSAGESKAFSSL